MIISQLIRSHFKAKFDDLLNFRRYERMKDVIGGFKKNEDTLKKLADEAANKYQIAEDRYNRLRSHAEQRLSE